MQGGGFRGGAGRRDEVTVACAPRIARIPLHHAVSAKRDDDGGINRGNVASYKPILLI